MHGADRIPDEGGVTEAIQRQLTLFARRVRAQAHQLHPELSLVAYSLLSQVSATGGCRSADLAAVYHLDKSTVSRQVGDLERRGLLRRDPAGDRLLRTTPHGETVLAAASARQREALRRRLAGWSERDRATFAKLLERFNEPEEEAGPSSSM
jgi:DNA-binding MarR family transcriptional regulator